MPYTVGCVPYVNARPLVHFFDELGEDSPVQVVYDVPANLPKLLQHGQAQAILVSSIEALQNPERRAVESVGICTEGPAESVRLFSKRPFDQIQSVALDQSSMTSNALCQILLTEKFGIQPFTRAEPPNLQIMLQQYDAALLIGDAGYEANSEGLHVLDLGQAWSQMSGLPFVWALWVGKEQLSSVLSLHLLTSMVWGLSNLDEVVIEAAERNQWPHERCEHYLLRTMKYEVGDREIQGLQLFGELIVRHRLATQASSPIWVEAADPELAGTFAP
jgi:chorismate dehydratase